MREEKESITFYEEMYDSSSRYSRDYKHAYSIPEDCGCYRLKDECTSLELKGRESLCTELILPPSFSSFYVESIDCLPYLRKITSYSEFFFVSGSGFIEHNVVSFWENSQLEEICVLPWLVDKYKQTFGYWPELSDAIIRVTALPESIAYKLTSTKENGLVTSRNGRTLIKVDKDIRILEIPIEIERVAASTFETENNIEKIIIGGNSEDYHKDRRGNFDFDKDAVNSLGKVKTLVFHGPMYTSFYDDDLKGAKMPNLETIIYPLWNYNHFCFRGSKAESADIYPYEIKAENFSSIELVEEDGIVYTKDGKFLVSGVDCKKKRISIKDGVEEIFKYAFCCNLNIEEVYIPQSVTTVGECAFKSCKNIKKIIFNFNQITKDAEHAFFTYSQNIHFYFPDSHFQNVIKQQYEKLHNHFSSMGLGALTEKQVKDNSINIVMHTLPDYSGEILIDEESGMVYDEKGETFVGVLKEQAKDIITLIIPDHVKDISQHAFSRLLVVENIIVSGEFNIRKLYELAKRCPKIKTIIAGEDKIIIEDGIVYLNEYKEIMAIQSGIKITNVVCKEGVETIHPSVFENHKELIRIQLPQTIKTIGERAFANTGLSEVTIPASLQEFGKDVFYSCTLSSVVFDGKVPIGQYVFNGVKFAPSAFILVKKEFKEDFVKTYPAIKKLIKSPLPKWLSWLSYIH